MEITEPVASSETSGLSEATPIPEIDLIPLSQLSAEERERRRRERERILDILEEEERMEEKATYETALERRKEAIRRQEEAARSEKDRLKATKEMQKKMGKALLQDIAKAREREEIANKKAFSAPPEKHDKVPSVKKKVVTFAEEPDVKPDTPSPSREFCWGDVVPAKLRASTNRPSLISKSDQPMKSSVVERMPGTPTVATGTGWDNDSDDDSNPPDSSSDSGRHYSIIAATSILTPLQ